MDLVAAAMALPPGAREAFVRAECPGDEALAAEALDLIRAAGDAGGFLQPGGTGVTGGAGVRRLIERALSSPEQPGSAVGPYRLVEPLGEGGFATVFLAEQMRPVRRRVAVKIIKPGMDTREVITRFEQERQALAVMDHPAIARVFDAGVTDSGRPFFAMELVEGRPITAFSDERRLSIRQRLDLFVQVCHAVQHAHTKGIIHRDLKPGNILVRAGEQGPAPKVIDFGIAKATAASARLTERTLITSAFQFIGTPEYMSPEQFGAADIDTRSDIYSLGVVLYELLIGDTPIDRRTLRASSLAQLHRLVLERDPDPPSTRVASLSSGLAPIAAARSVAAPRLPACIRGDLDAITLRCLEKDRARRYPTADALAEDIQRHLRGEPVLARPPSIGYRAAKFVRRHRVGVLATTLAALALLAGLAAATFGLAQARRERTEANLQADRAQRTADFLTRTMNAIGPGVALGRDTRLLRGVMDDAAHRLESGELADNPQAEAELRITIGNAYSQLGAHADAVRILSGAVEASRRVWPGDHPTTARALDLLGQARHLAGDDPRALEEITEAYQMRRRLTPGDSFDLAESINNIGWVLSSTHEFEASERRYREALDMARRITAQDDERTALFLHNLGGLLADRRNLAEGEAMLRESLAMHRRLFPGRHPAVATAMYSLAKVLAARGETAEAEDLYRQALDMRRALYEGDHVLVMQAYYVLADLLLNQDRAQEAEPLARTGLAMAERLGESTTGLRQELVRCLIASGKLDEAETLSRAMLEEVENAPNPSAPMIAASHLRLAMVLMRADKVDDAERHLLTCLRIRRETYKKEHFDLAATLVLLAECAQKQGRTTLALERAREAQAIASRTTPPTASARERIDNLVKELEAGSGSK